MRHSAVYNYKCNCRALYIDNTKLQLFGRVPQNQGVSFRTANHSAKDDNSAIWDHCDNINHAFLPDNFTVIDSCPHSIDLRTLESLHIYSDQSTLNSDKGATALKCSILYVLSQITCSSLAT